MHSEFWNYYLICISIKQTVTLSTQKHLVTWRVLKFRKRNIGTSQPSAGNSLLLRPRSAYTSPNLSSLH